jgi:hypothetical protein
MDPESSIRRTVSNCFKNAYLSSPVLGIVVVVDIVTAAAELELGARLAGDVYAGLGPRVGPDAAVGDGV